MLDALSAAHSQGFIHGAITPGSILMTNRARGGHLYIILDMGLCRLAPLIQGRDSILSIMADPAILAPELFSGNTESDEKSDLYMLGNIIYMSLTGGHPFANKTSEQCMLLNKQGLPPITDYVTDVPADFVAWIEQLCRVNPAERPASVIEALQIMPKVDKPAKSSQMHPGMASATTLLTSAPSNTTIPANITGPLIPANATGPLSTSASLPLGGQTTGSLSAIRQDKTTKKTTASNSAIYITIAAIALIGIILTFTIGGAKNKKTGEQIAAQKAIKEEQASPDVANHSSSERKKITSRAKSSRVSNKKERSPKKSTQVRNDPAILFSFVASSGSPEDQNWKLKYYKNIEMKDSSLVIKNKDSKITPGIRSKFRSKHIEAMNIEGWSLTYEVLPISGEHQVGMHLKSLSHQNWIATGSQLSTAIIFNRKENDVTVRFKGDTLEHTIKDVGENYITVLLQGKPRDESGSLKLYIDGKEITSLQPALTKDNDYGIYTNTCFSSSIKESPKGASHWKIKKLILVVGNKEDK